MNIKRFDETEFRAIQCGNSGGYYQDGSDEAERAVLLMEEGIYLHNPKGNWHVNGWKFSDLGKEYYKEFMRKVQEKHGHIWLTYKDREPEYYKDDEYGNTVDIFAYSQDYHNGPECKNCGYSFCQHCDAEIDVPVCSKRK